MLFQAYKVYLDRVVYADIIEYDNAHYTFSRDGVDHHEVTTLIISGRRFQQVISITIEECYADITMGKIKGACPTMSDDDLWEELSIYVAKHVEDQDKNSRRYKSRQNTIQFIAFVILYRKYGTMFTMMEFDDE